MKEKLTFLESTIILIIHIITQSYLLQQSNNLILHKIYNFPIINYIQASAIALVFDIIKSSLINYIYEIERKERTMAAIISTRLILFIIVLITIHIFSYYLCKHV